MLAPAGGQWCAACATYYDGYSVNDTGDRMNDGAVILLRSPEKLAMDLMN